MKTFKTPFVLALAASATLIVAGCSMMGGGGGGKAPTPDELIDKPNATVSPDMDFTKISAAGIFPLFPGGETQEDDAMAERLVTSLTSQVTQRQGQWKIMSFRDLLEVINKNNLGTGYKNLQADFNTPASPGSTSFVLSGGTKQFLIDLQKAANVQAFLIGSYELGSKTTQEPLPQGFSLPGSTPPPQQYRAVMHKTTSVHVALFYVPDQKVWWNATVLGRGEADQVVDPMTASLGSYLGKGRLQQL